MLGKYRLGDREAARQGNRPRYLPGSARDPRAAGNSAQALLANLPDVISPHQPMLDPAHRVDMSLSEAR